MEHAAYNNVASLSEIDEQKLAEIEKYINDMDRDVIQTLTCCHSKTYQEQKSFKFLPGHKSMILAFPKKITQMAEMKKNNCARKKLLSPADLKNSLIARLNLNMNKYNQQHRTPNQFSLDHLSEWQTEENGMTAKCKVLCVECNVVTPVTYSKSWCISNVLRHLKSHFGSKRRRLNGGFFTRFF